MNHLLAHHPVELTTAGAAALDLGVKKAFGAIFRLSGDELERCAAQLSLPTRNGGFGLTKLVDSAYFQRFAAIARSIGTVRGVLSRVFEDGSRALLFPKLPSLIASIKRLADIDDTDSLNEDLALLMAVNEGSLPHSGQLARRFERLKEHLWGKYHASRVRE